MDTLKSLTWQIKDENADKVCTLYIHGISVTMPIIVIVIVIVIDIDIVI